MMSSFERVLNTLNLKPVDVIPFRIDPWRTTLERWRQEGHLKEHESAGDHFDQDIRIVGGINSIANLDFEETVLEETDETFLVLDGNGAKLRHSKLHVTTPEHVDFAVKGKNDWEEIIKPHLVAVDLRRIPFQQYRTSNAAYREKQKFVCLGLRGPFEMIHPVCGHETLLFSMAADPEWVKDMVLTYVDFTINHMEELFRIEGIPDGIWFYEDLGYKLKPFMSLKMYMQILYPGHKRLFDFAHSKGCKIILHSCGFIEPFVPIFIEAGIDCLQGLEVKAGMDMPRLFEKYGDKIAFCGGIDTRILITNDFKKIEAELIRNIPVIINNGGSYILHTDHSEPPEINYETIKYFIKRAKEIATGRI